MCTFGAFAQQVIVTSSDGLATKFSANRVKDITFTKTGAPEPETVVFNRASVSGTSASVYLTLYAEDGTEFESYICSQTGATFLSEGVFTASPNNEPMTWDNGGYTSLKLGGTKYDVQAGTITVSRAAAVYTIVVDVTLEGGDAFKGQYVGELPGYSPILTADCSKIDVMDIDGRVPGEFYVKLNDANWNWNIVFDFYAAADAATLPAGTYNFNADNTPGTYGSKSYIECYSPSFNIKPSQPVTVSYSGTDIVIHGVFTDEAGHEITVNYQGPVTFPAPVEPNPNQYEGVHFTEFLLDNEINDIVTLQFSNDDYVMVLDCYRPADSNILDAGVYTVNDSMDEFTIDSYDLYTYIYPTEDPYEKRGIDSGTMTVSLDGDVYTVLFDFMVSGQAMKGYYVGQLEGLSPNAARIIKRLGSARTQQK